MSNPDPASHSTSDPRYLNDVYGLVFAATLNRGLAARLTESVFRYGGAARRHGGRLDSECGRRAMITAAYRAWRAQVGPVSLEDQWFWLSVRGQTAGEDDVIGAPEEHTIAAVLPALTPVTRVTLWLWSVARYDTDGIAAVLNIAPAHARFLVRGATERVTTESRNLVTWRSNGPRPDASSLTRAGMARKPGPVAPKTFIAWRPSLGGRLNSTP